MTTERSPMPDVQSNDQPGALLRALVLCDLADSTALVERLGDQTAAELIRRHDRMARSIMERHDGREIDKTDGFLVLFERPINGVAFALEYQRKLRALAQEAGQALSARVGIDFGEVIAWNNSPADIAKGAKPLEVEGLAKPLAARLMALACPGQILLSGVAHTLAQRAEGECGALPGTVRWLMHGRYHLKGIAEPVAVFEVGEPGIAPMRPPPASGKASPAKPFWRHRVSLTIAVAALLIGAAVLLYLSTRNEPPLAFNERDWVVIGDLDNVNGDKTLVPALNAAFRIGIEESRFVNVVPDVAVRQALGRMQRDRGTRIDRDIGSEIALREQARAVILPSIAQYGPKLRLVVELIDPNGAHTVSTQTADADGPADILPAMDRLLQGTRSRLGESLQQIQATSQPLDRVTTPNLGALRALSRGLQVARTGDFEQAGKLLAYATELDPDFATAYARMGSVLISQQRYADARAALERALNIKGRLSERERLYVRGQLARFDEPGAMLDAWRMYASLYPDQGTGQNNVGNVYYMFLHDYPHAEAALTQVAATHPLYNLTLQMLGHVLLAQEKFEQSEKQFKKANALAPAVMLFGLSDALVAGGKLEEATRYLDETVRQPPITEVERSMRRATLLIARGDVDAAMRAIAAVVPQTEGLPAPNYRWRAQNAMIALRFAQADAAGAREVVARVLAEISSVAAHPNANLLAIEQLLYAASWAARLGLVSNARDALTLAKQQGTIERFPVRMKLATLTQAEMDLYMGHAEIVANRLQNLGPDTSLWELHEVRARALRRLGDDDGESAELKWLTSHRGLAYAQWTDELLGQQARAIALRDAELRLSESGRRPATDRRPS